MSHHQVHRCLRPSNILLNKRGAIKVLLPSLQCFSSTLSLFLNPSPSLIPVSSRRSSPTWRGTPPPPPPSPRRAAWRPPAAAPGWDQKLILGEFTCVHLLSLSVGITAC